MKLHPGGGAGRAQCVPARTALSSPTDLQLGEYTRQPSLFSCCLLEQTGWDGNEYITLSSVLDALFQPRFITLCHIPPTIAVGRRAPTTRSHFSVAFYCCSCLVMLFLLLTAQHNIDYVTRLLPARSLHSSVYWSWVVIRKKKRRSLIAALKHTQSR